MDGKYLNNKKIESSILDWIKKNASSTDSWQANGMHIDEIDGLHTIVYEEWINTSFMILNYISTRFLPIESLILFMHIDLKNSYESTMLSNLSAEWLKNNISEYTPPSFHYTSLDYYNNFYCKELVQCNVDKEILKYFDIVDKAAFFYRTKFDLSEEMYSREIYIFIMAE